MLVPHGALILVLDGSHVRLMRNRGKDTTLALEVLHEGTLRNPRGHALTSDGPGRSFESAGPGRHAYSQVDHHQQREDHFGREALDLLSSGEKDAPVILIAPPHMLGDLRAHGDAQLAKRIVAEIDKDLTHQSPTEIARFLHLHHG